MVVHRGLKSDVLGPVLDRDAARSPLGMPRDSGCSGVFGKEGCSFAEGAEWSDKLLERPLKKDRHREASLAFRPPDPDGS